MAGGPWGICDRCGFKYRLSHLRKEWTGLMVCKADWDPRPPEMRPPVLRPEGLPLRDARPEPPWVIREDGELGGDDL